MIKEENGYLIITDEDIKEVFLSGCHIEGELKIHGNIIRNGIDITNNFVRKKKKG